MCVIRSARFGFIQRVNGVSHVLNLCCNNQTVTVFKCAAIYIAI